jgi:hypothetical protein
MAGLDAPAHNGKAISAMAGLSRRAPSVTRPVTRWGPADAAPASRRASMTRACSGSGQLDRLALELLGILEDLHFSETFPGRM